MHSGPPQEAHSLALVDVAFALFVLDSESSKRSKRTKFVHADDISDVNAEDAFVEKKPEPPRLATKIRDRKRERTNVEKNLEVSQHATRAQVKESRSDGAAQPALHAPVHNTRAASRQLLYPKSSFAVVNEARSEQPREPALSDNKMYPKSSFAVVNETRSEQPRKPALSDYKTMCSNIIDGSLVFDPTLKPEAQVRIDDSPLVDIVLFERTPDMGGWGRLPKLVYRNHCNGIVLLWVVGDGNCFFRVLSVYKFSHENGWALMRYMTTVHISQHRHLYVNTFGNSTTTNTLRILSQVGIRGKMDAYVNKVIMVGAATMLGRAIILFGPLRELKEHEAATPSTVVPLVTGAVQPPLIMEWSNTFNHFSALVGDQPERDVIRSRTSAAPGKRWPPLFPPIQHSELNCVKRLGLPEQVLNDKEEWWMVGLLTDVRRQAPAKESPAFERLIQQKHLTDHQWFDLKALCPTSKGNQLNEAVKRLQQASVVDRCQAAS
jgi:hypothetical protein